MTFDPFFQAPAAIQLHTLCALAALVLTPVILLARKGDTRHKALGRVWVAAMALTALSSFAITEIRLIGPYSPIHLLSILTLVSLVNAVRFARRRRIEAHRKAILGAAAGLVGAGLFTLLPGRMMSQIIFPDLAVPGFAAVLALSLFLAGLYLRQSRRAALR